ncbi:MAG: hypothetical protein ABI881_11660 [Betaproteobacteria bacterium]
MHRLIGGFLPLRFLDAEVAGSLYSSWCSSSADVWCFHNARSALNALWTAMAPPTIWLPAYVCEEVARSVPSNCVPRYFPLDSQLRPSVVFLDEHVRAGEHVLAVDYFGRPQNAEFFTLAKSRPDVGWVQDCAQAVAGFSQAWGDWLIYSPRKVVGVPDGGILVSRREKLPAANTLPLTDLSFVLPVIGRSEDGDERNNSHWYANYIEVEERFEVGRLQMSDLSLSIIKRTPFQADSEVRRRNYETLQEHLSPWAFFGELPIDFIPLGFPVISRNAGRASASLAAQGIFAPRHWTTLPSDRERFALEHNLARALLTLPCDYRYDTSDMMRVAKAAREVLVDDSV